METDRVKRRENAAALRKRQDDWRPNPRGRISDVLNQRKTKREQPEAWTCPVCGRANARYWAHCPDCGPEVRRP